MSGQQPPSLFGNSAFGASTATTTATATQGAHDKNKEKRFYDWHQKQGISAPQDYGMFASQPAPFSSVPQNPNHPTAASPYLQKVLSQQAINAMNGGGASNDANMADGRRKSTIKRSASSPPSSPDGAWPKQMFGTRPPSRTRARTSSTPDISGDLVSEENAPPLTSIYDTWAPPPSTTETKPASEAAWTPTQVKVAGFSEDRFPELIRALRRYYGVILEPYSGLPESESKFFDPEIVPREKLDLATARMVQPMSGREGGPGPWVRITFARREDAERAIEGSQRGELVIGGRTIIITRWQEEPVQPATPSELPFTMDIEPTTPTPALLRRLSSASQRRPTATSLYEEPPASNGEPQSEHVPGAKLVVPKQVEFAKKEGWLGGWANALIGSGSKSAPGSATKLQEQGWGLSIGGTYRYVMDEVVGLKHL